MPLDGTSCPIEQKNPGVARDSFLDEHVRLIPEVCPERHEVMLAPLDEYLPSGGVLSRRV